MNNNNLPGISNIISVLCALGVSVSMVKVQFKRIDLAIKKELNTYNLLEDKFFYLGIICLSILIY